MNLQQRVISFIQFQLPAAAWCFFIYVASSIPQSKLPELVTYSDKVVHAGVFGILCWLLHVALSHQGNYTLKRHGLMIAVVFVFLYGVSDEYHQLFTPGRSSDPYDVLADVSGGVIYVMAALRFKFYRDE